MPAAYVTPASSPAVLREPALSGVEGSSHRTASPHELVTPASSPAVVREPALSEVEGRPRPHIRRFVPLMPRSLAPCPSCHPERSPPRRTKSKDLRLFFVIEFRARAVFFSVPAQTRPTRAKCSTLCDRDPVKCEPGSSQKVPNVRLNVRESLRGAPSNFPKQG